jgi:peptide/nickel transport system permease protein
VLGFVVRRVLSVIPTLLGATFIVFVLLDLAPGNPARRIAGEGATPEEVDRISRALGLDDPLLVRYWRFLGDAVHGDLGTSLFSSRTVWDAFSSRMPITLGIVLPALALSILVAVPAGAFAALHRDGISDRLLTAGAAIAMAVPSFVLGVVLVVTFAVKRSWFPATGYAGPSEGLFEWVKHSTLPAITLAGVGAAELARQVRGALIETLDQDYIRTARAKGLSRAVVVAKHAAKNAAIPVVTVLGLQVAALVGGSVLVERVYAIPGFGAFVVDSVLKRDIPMIQGIVAITALVVLGVNLLVDLSYGYFDPRLRDR